PACMLASMKRARKFPPCTDHFVYATCLVAVSACGGTAAAPAAPEPASSGQVAPSAAPAPAPTPEPSAAPPAPEPAPVATPEPPAAEAAPHGTNITYRMTPTGLVIEFEGLHLEPKAEPIQLGNGWGVKLTMRAKATDDQEHQLQNPANGPLMVA